MIARTSAARWMVLCLLVLCACSPEMRRTLGDLSRLYDSIAARYHPESGQVSLMNGHTLVITLVNVPGRTVPSPANKEWARGVAQFAYAGYPDRKEITGVTIVLSNKHAVLFFSYAESERLSFTAEELSATPAAK